MQQHSLSIVILRLLLHIANTISIYKSLYEAKKTHSPSINESLFLS